MKKTLLFTFILFYMCNIYAQNYKIDFTGSGESNTIDKVIVKNLTQDTDLEINGDDILNILFNVNIADINNQNSELKLYPNPMNEATNLEFNTPYKGKVKIRILDIVGKIIHIHDMKLNQGKHTFTISGLSRGTYLIEISGKEYSYTTKLISQSDSNSNNNLSIKHLTSDQNFTKNSTNKSNVQMYFNDGDLLLLKGYSGDFCTIVTVYPDADTTINFEFVKCTDYDGNNYPVVKIGDHLWMAEALKTTHYRNGEPIEHPTDNDEWENNETGAYCWYNNDENNKDTYGALYNWFTVENENNIAPEGWRIATKNEIQELSGGAVGGSFSRNGGKLKATGTEHWNEPNTDATNSTGFTALPGGYRDPNGTFEELGITSYCTWSSSTDGPQVGWYIAVENISNKAFLYGWYKETGFSIRCIKEE